MRILLLASFDSIAAKDDAITLSARGYDVVTFCDLHSRDYPLNQGFPAGDLRVRENLNAELLQGTLAVVHPDVKPEHLGLAAAFCHLLVRPMVYLADLDLCAVSMSQERIDAANMLDQVPTAIHELLDLVERASVITVPKLEVVRDARAGDVIQLNPSKRKPNLWQRLRNAEHALNRMLGNSLKNPNTRVQAMPAPRPYVLDTSPPSVTG